jgi:ABC-type transporter Mla maintaining outer membrane lipid asymmetry ATPase subunit MlaF
MSDSSPASAAPEIRGVGISLQNITKRFGEFTAVDDVSLDIAPGEFLVILGPSGCASPPCCGWWPGWRP